MRLKLTLVLLLANLAVFAVLWRLDRASAAPPSASANLIPPLLTNLDSLEISGRMLADPPAARVLKLVAGRWQITEPVQWPADRLAVNNLINQLQFLEQETSFSADDLAASNMKLADYGLEDPGLVLKLTDGKNSAQLLVGNTTSFANRVYVMNPEEKIIRVVSQDLLESLVQPVQNLQDRRIFSVPPFEIRELSISGEPPPLSGAPGGGPAAGTPARVTLVKEGDAWRMEIPVNAPADSELVTGIVAKLDLLTVERFLAPGDQDRARQGLTTPALRITLRGNASQTLLVGNSVPPPAAAPAGLPPPPPQVFAQIEGVPQVFVVNASAFEDLRRAQETLRERRFFVFDPAKITAFSVAFGDRSVRLQKKESGAAPWQVLANDAGGAVAPVAADTDLVDKLLGDLRQLRAIHFASDEARPSQEDLKAFGLSESDATWVVTLQQAAGERPLVLRLGIVVAPAQLGPEPTVRYYAAVDGSPSIYEIGPAIRGRLSVDPLYYRDRILDVLPAAAQVEALTLTDLRQPATPMAAYALSPEAPVWPQALAGEPAAVRDAVLALVEAMRQFGVASYLRVGFGDGYEFDGQPVPWRYRLDAKISLPRAATGDTPALTQTRTYYFSDRLGGTMQLGGTPPPPADSTTPAGPPPMIFTLTQPMIDALYALTLARTPPGEAPRALEEMTQPINPRPAGTQAPPPPPPPAEAGPSVEPGRFNPPPIQAPPPPAQLAPTLDPSQSGGR